MSVETSLERFGTNAFDRETMLAAITKDLITGQIDAMVWWDLVPEVYRREASAIAVRVAANFSGRPLTDDVPKLFAEHLHRAIWRDLRPIWDT